MEVMQQMVEKFKKAEHLLGVSIPVGNGNGDGGKVAVGASVKSAGSSLKKTSSFMGRCDRSDESRYISTEKPIDRSGKFRSNRSDESRSISTEKPKVVSAAAVSQGPSSRFRALKEDSVAAAGGRQERLASCRVCGATIVE